MSSGIILNVQSIAITKYISLALSPTVGTVCTHCINLSPTKIMECIILKNKRNIISFSVIDARFCI